jgi:hypothetical protein
MGGQTMKATGLAAALLLFGVQPALAGHYETYAFGDTEAEACDQVKSDLRDQAILQCRMNGAVFDKADYGACRKTQFEHGRYKVVRSVEFTCKPK